MKKNKIFLIITSIIICIALGCSIFFVYPKFHNEINQEDRIDIKTDDLSTTTFSDGKNFYHPSSEDIQYDENEKTIFYHNLLTVGLDGELNDEIQNLIEKTSQGKIVNQTNGLIKMLDVKVKEQSYSELQNLANDLMNLNGVVFSTPSLPVVMESQSIWDDEKDLGNEENPGGADWWAEAIGLYTAWSNSDLCNSSIIGVMDDGFDLKHQDLQRNGSPIITMLNKNSIENFGKKDVSSHGTHVVGVIGAQDNDYGMRGIVESGDLVCIDWKDKKNSLLTPTAVGESFEQFLTYAQSKDLPIVINNSWGNYQSLSDFLLNSLDLNDMISDLNENEKYSMYTSAWALYIVDQLLLNSKSDFLVVQSAGNGYGNGSANTGYEANLSGWFAGITEDSRKQVSTAFDLETIKGHIISVGSVKNVKGKYKLSKFSNYGNNIDIVAPGEKIYSTGVGDSYIYLSGTSMAAPIVSGSVSYIWAVDPKLSAIEVKDMLISNASIATKTNSKDKRKEYPMLNIGNVASYLSSTIRTEERRKNNNEVEVEIDENLWKSCYLDFIENRIPDLYGKDYVNTDSQFSLIYINDDQIPELFCNWGSSADGANLITFKNNSLESNRLSSINMASYGLSYIPNSGFLKDSGGRMDSYYDKIYKIEAGDINLVAEGTYGAENNAQVQFDENGLPIYLYKWESNNLAKDGYQKELNSVFDTSLETFPSQDKVMSLQEIRKYLSNGNYQVSESNELAEETFVNGLSAEDLDGFWFSDDYRYFYLVNFAGVGLINTKYNNYFTMVDLQNDYQNYSGAVKGTSDGKVYFNANQDNQPDLTFQYQDGKLIGTDFSLTRTVDQKTGAILGLWGNNEEYIEFKEDGFFKCKKNGEISSGEFYFSNTQKLVMSNGAHNFQLYSLRFNGTDGINIYLIKPDKSEELWGSFNY